jgi:hypothetical protein
LHGAGDAGGPRPAAGPGGPRARRPAPPLDAGADAAQRAGVVHHLAQALADAAAAAEGEPARLLPRLDADLALPDQLAVTADDLVRSRPSARVARDALAHLLWHRAHLLDEPVPASLAARLGLPDGAAVLAEGRAACRGPSG